MRRSLAGAAALGWALSASVGCGPTLMPVEDPSGSDSPVYSLDLGWPEKVETLVLKTSLYAPALRLYFAPVEDARDDRTHLGELTGGSAPAPIVAAGMPPSVFVAQVVAKELADSGITLVGRDDAPNRILRVRLVRFFTEEHHMYHGEVRATAEVLDSTRQVLAAITATGSARLFGRSRSVEDYREIFARATTDMVKNVLENERIQAALDVRGNAASSPPVLRAADGGAS